MTSDQRVVTVNGDREPLITRADIIAILDQWQNGSLTASQVHTWAEDRYAPGWTEFDDWEGEAEESVANTVLAYLDMRDMNLVLPEDIPIYLQFLATPSGHFHEGARLWWAALSRIDYKDRRKALRAIPPYTRYCK